MVNHRAPSEAIHGAEGTLPSTENRGIYQSGVTIYAKLR